MKSFLLLVTSILTISTATVQARTRGDGNISVYGGPFAYKTNFSSAKYSGKVPDQAGLGLVVVGDIDESSGLEIGMFFLNKTYFRQDNNSFLVEETKLAHIAMGYRRQMTDLLSGSITFSSGYAMGDPTVIRNDFANGSGVDTSVRDTAEYGFDFSLQAEMFREANPSFVTDIRYYKSLTPKPSESADHYGVMFGLQYQLQEKTRNGNLKK